MAVSVQTFTQFVQNQVAAIQGTCSALIDFTVGSVLRAFTEANAAQGLFLQAQALQVAALTRAATSNGPDLDTYFADFSFTRLAASQSEGNLTFARFTATGTTNLPVGTTAQSFDGSQQFTVLADPTNAAYNAGLNAYVLAANVSSVTVLAQSVNAAAAANVNAGTITQITSTVPGIDTVTNASAFEGGADPETDAAYRARFVNYLASLSKATRAAVLYAANSVQTGLTQSLVENQSYAGSTQPGYFYDVVDDGSGNPPTLLLTNVAAAIELVRPLGTTYSVFAPIKITATVAMTLNTASGYTHATVTAAVSAALTAYINALPLGTSLPYSLLSKIAYDTSPGVLNVTAVTLNGVTADLTATNQQVIRSGTMTVA